MKFRLVPAAESLLQVLLLSYSTYRTKVCPQHLRFVVSHARETRGNNYIPFLLPVLREAYDVMWLFPINNAEEGFRVQAEELGIPDPVDTETSYWHPEEVVDDGTGGSCCEPPKTGHSTAAEAGNQELTSARHPKTACFACSWPGPCFNRCERTGTMGLGGKKKEREKKQKHKREGEKGMWSWLDEKT